MEMQYLREKTRKEQTNTISSSFRAKKLVTFFSLVVILLALPISLFLVNLQGQLQQPAARAAGNTYFANPGDDIQSKVSVLQPGDTLIFNDGTYKSLRLDANIGTAINGTASAPITLKAEHDGKAIFDPAGATEPIFLHNNSYITLQGFVARNSSASVVSLDGPNDHITLQRITAYNAAAGNHHVFDVSFGSTNVLVEDCAGWGQGRYIFIAYHTDHVTFRRDFAYAPYQPQAAFSPAPRSAFGVYGASNVLLENDLGISAIPPTTDDNYYSAVWHTSDDPTNYPDGQTTYLGDIFYNDCEGIAMTGTSGNNVTTNNTTYKDVYIDIPSSTACQSYTTKYNGNARGLDWGASYGGSITNATIVNAPTAGFNTYSTSGRPSLTNSVFLNNQTAITNGDPGQSYLDFYGTGSNSISLNSTDKIVNPNYDTTTYGRGAYLMPAPSLLGQGQNGGDIGSHIIYEYVNGQLTNTPLWPWPMEDRIMAEKGISITYAANGGIWKTLSGVYPNATITPTPFPTTASTPTPTLVPNTISPTPTLVPNTISPTPTLVPNTTSPTPTLVPDTTSPIVNITNPLNGSTVKRRTTVTITASASDNVGVSKVEFSVNNSLLCTDSTAPYAFTWSVPGKRGVTYTITAKVYDEAGNSAINSITVTSSQ